MVAAFALPIPKFMILKPSMNLETDLYLKILEACWYCSDENIFELKIIMRIECHIEHSQRYIDVNGNRLGREKIS